MSPSRSPANCDHATGSESQQSARPTALLPRLGSSVEITPDARELALDLGENLFPGKQSIEELSPVERKHWIVLSANVLWGKSDLQHSIEAIAQVLGPGVQAGIEDILIKREFFFEKEAKKAQIEEEEREERRQRESATHVSNLMDQAQERQLARKRQALEESQWLLEEEERKTRLKNRDRRERTGLAMAVAGFLVAAAILVIGFKSGAPLVGAGSGAVAATILGVILRLVLTERGEEPHTTRDREGTTQG